MHVGHFWLRTRQSPSRRRALLTCCYRIIEAIVMVITIEMFCLYFDLKCHAIPLKSKNRQRRLVYLLVLAPWKVVSWVTFGRLKAERAIIWIRFEYDYRRVSTSIIPYSCDYYGVIYSLPHDAWKMCNLYSSLSCRSRHPLSVVPVKCRLSVSSLVEREFDM